MDEHKKSGVDLNIANKNFADRLSRAHEITITVTGRKSGRKISLPIWFVSEAGKLYLLPATGSDTQWYKNVLRNPAMRVESGGAQAEVKVGTVTDTAQVKSVVERFRGKYGPGDVKKYYSKFDVAVIADV